MTTISNIQVDVTLSERHSQKVALTVHPIESGMNPTDHARIEPAQYTIEGIFSNSPLPNPNVNSPGGLDRFATDSYAKKTSDQMWQMLSSREVQTIVTPLRTYQNMILTSLDMPVDPAIGQDVQFSATFNEIRFVNVETVTLAAAPTQPTVKTNQSKQQPTQATTAQQQSGLAVFDDLANKGISGALF